MISTNVWAVEIAAADDQYYADAAEAGLLGTDPALVTEDTLPILGATGLYNTMLIVYMDTDDRRAVERAAGRAAMIDREHRVAVSIRVAQLDRWNVEWAQGDPRELAAKRNAIHLAVRYVWGFLADEVEPAVDFGTVYAPAGKDVPAELATLGWPVHVTLAEAAPTVVVADEDYA